MAGGGGGGEQNYWPGFVDALSNVVLTLVFVLVVFVFALLISSGKVQQKNAQMVEQKDEQETSARKQIGEIREQLKKAEEKRDQLATEVEGLKVANKTLEAFRLAIEEKERAVTPSIVEKRVDLAVDAPDKPGEPNKELADVNGGNVIVITYPRTAVALNEKAKAALAKVINGQRARLSGAKAVIDSIMGTETYSEGRRMAYYRALDIRNFLLDNKIASAQMIETNTKQSKEPGDARIEIRFVR